MTNTNRIEAFHVLSDAIADSTVRGGAQVAAIPGSGYLSLDASGWAYDCNGVQLPANMVAGTRLSV